MNAPSENRKIITVLGLGIALGLCVIWFNHSVATKAPPAVDASAARSELLTMLAALPGETSANTDDSSVQVDFKTEMSSPEMKTVALTAARSLCSINAKANHVWKVTSSVLINGSKRYELDYDPQNGIVKEREF